MCTGGQDPQAGSPVLCVQSQGSPSEICPGATLSKKYPEEDRERFEIPVQDTVPLTDHPLEKEEHKRQE